MWKAQDYLHDLTAAHASLNHGFLSARVLCFLKRTDRKRCARTRSNLPGWERPLHGRILLGGFGTNQASRPPFRTTNPKPCAAESRLPGRRWRLQLKDT